uniref:Uncharacterized protein n=1 Tax=Kalanchoe fedtschenkoi TaxID=63787 RepID=A0A7N0USV8_KALFE
MVEDVRNFSQRNRKMTSIILSGVVAGCILMWFC